MDGRAHIRTDSGWQKFDLRVLTIAALGALFLGLLNHWGYGPKSYKNCFNGGTPTIQEQVKAELPKVAQPVVPAPATVAAPKPDPVEVAQVKVQTAPAIAWPVVAEGPVVTAPAPQPVAEITAEPSIAPTTHPVVDGPAELTPVAGPAIISFVTTEGATRDASLQAIKTGNQVSLSGAVPSAEVKSNLIADAQRALSSDGVVIDRLVVDTQVKPAAWLGSGAKVVRMLSQMREQSAVYVAGQDVRLTGTVTGSTDREVVGLAAVEIFGPDSKLYNLVSLKPLVESAIEIETRGKRAIVTGKIDTEGAYTNLMQSLTSVFGNGNITDRLAVDENTSPISWQPASLQVASALSNVKQPAGVRITRDRAVLFGLADAESEKSARGVIMHKLLGPSVTIDNKITVRDLTAPVVDFQNSDGKLTLSGQVGDEETRTALVNAANTAFGASNVTDRLSVGDMTGQIGWAVSIGQVTEQVLSLKLPGGIRASGNTVTLTGTVQQENERDARQAAAKSLFGPAVTIDNQLRVIAPIVAAPEPLPVPDTPPQPEPQVAVSPPPVPVVDCNLIAKGAVVEFATNKAELTDNGRGVLDQVLACLKEQSYEVGGHTDSTGKPAWNKELSLLRANATVTYLIGKGVERSRLVAKGLGSSQPVASNGSPEGRAKNRRITFTVKP